MARGFTNANSCSAKTTSPITTAPSPTRRVADTAFLHVSGNVVHVFGHTGLGVESTRFGAATMLDLLDGQYTERTRPARTPRDPAATSTGGIGTWNSRPRTSSAFASTLRKPEPRPRGPGFWLGHATMSAGYPSEPKFTIDSISAALRSRGCSPRATFSLSTK